MTHTWMFLKLEHTNGNWLQEMEPRQFEAAINYLLGNRARGLNSSRPNRELVYPTWEMILHVEKEFGKAVCDRITSEGETMKQTSERTTYSNTSPTMSEAAN